MADVPVTYISAFRAPAGDAQFDLCVIDTNPNPRIKEILVEIDRQNADDELRAKRIAMCAAYESQLGFQFGGRREMERRLALIEEERFNAPPAPPLPARRASEDRRARCRACRTG